VIDLGIDVPAEKFVDAIKESKLKVVALSGFLTIAFEAMKDTIEKIKAAGLREGVKIMIGGGTVDDNIKEFAGADAFGDSAVDAVNFAKKWYGVN
ncbi:MAG: cobalamin B12-binding domain-containing protein, partial [Promethearchaeota archaeon]